MPETPDQDIENKKMYPSCNRFLQPQKKEIVSMARALNLKGWPAVPLDQTNYTIVEKLSGALTNTIYLVTPPNEYLLAVESSILENELPSKLVLRIFKPQNEYLIDRENELRILERVASRGLGPKVLGTFLNGRFEEFLESQTLTPEDLRKPSTSKKIARLIKELHDEVGLREEERYNGPSVWLNWEHWAPKCERRMTEFFDASVLRGEPTRSKFTGFTCGARWSIFKDTVDRYRIWLDDKYKGKSGQAQSLVFAHNDIQYGNILRLAPNDNSDLRTSLQANIDSNRLVLIDFEYGAANTPSCEIANHFTEWCYNYRDPVNPWSCNTTRYPTLNEQRSFVASYMSHYTQNTTQKGSSAVDEFLQEVRLWRAANSAEWITWAILQVEIPTLGQPIPQSASTEKFVQEGISGNIKFELEKRVERDQAHRSLGRGENTKLVCSADKTHQIEKYDGDECHEEVVFDYLAYAHDRALFFWGDLVSTGFMKKEDLPAEIAHYIKRVS